MAKTAYPTSTDLDDALTDQGFTVGTIDTAAAIAAAVDEFERRTGRRYVVPGADATRYYDPPDDGFLDLGADLAVLTRVDYQPAGAVAETLTQNTDYWLSPDNAGQPAEPLILPWTGLRLARRWQQPLPADLHRSILVVGRWAYATSTGFPEDVWLAMLQRGLWLVTGSMGNKISSGYREFQESGVTKNWGADPLQGSRMLWERNFELTVKRYRRRSI